jgi:hypothetical protein
MRQIVPIFAAALAACDDPGELGADAGLDTPSLEEAPAPQPSASTVRVAHEPDPRVRAQIVAAAPDGSARPTGPDGGTLVGSKTDVEGTAAVLPAPADSREQPGRSGPVRVEPLVSSPALERAARAQVYWTLAQKCTTSDGKLPPPESIVLSFTIAGDGTVDPTSITVRSDDPALAPVVDCVLREFAATPFSVPAARGSARSTVLIAWPSVD